MVRSTSAPVACCCYCCCSNVHVVDVLCMLQSFGAAAASASTASDTDDKLDFDPQIKISKLVLRGCKKGRGWIGHIVPNLAGLISPHFPPGVKYLKNCDVDFQEFGRSLLALPFLPARFEATNKAATSTCGRIETGY